MHDFYNSAPISQNIGAEDEKRGEMDWISLLYIVCIIEEMIGSAGVGGFYGWYFGSHYLGGKVELTTTMGIWIGVICGMYYSYRHGTLNEFLYGYESDYYDE